MQRELVRSFLAVRWRVCMLLVVSATSCVLMTLTVGAGLARQADVAARFAARTGEPLIVRGENLAPTDCARFAAIDQVDAVLGVGAAREVRSGRTFGGRGDFVGILPIVCADAAAVALLDDVVEYGRAPGFGEVVLSTSVADSIGVGVGDTFIDHATGVPMALVGTFNPTGLTSIGRLGGFTSWPEMGLRSIAIATGTGSEAQAVAGRALALIDPPMPSDVTIQLPTTLLDLQAEVAAELSRSDVVAARISAGSGLTMLGTVVVVSVLTRRRDTARLRAFGVSQLGAVIGLAAPVALVCLVGSGIGVGVGVALTAWTSQLPPLRVVVATSVLALLGGGLACLPGAVALIRAEPARILRVP